MHHIQDPIVRLGFNGGVLSSILILSWPDVIDQTVFPVQPVQFDYSVTASCKMPSFVSITTKESWH